MTTHQTPVSVFLSYVHEDEPLLRNLETHLRSLKQQGLITTWDARQIVAGTKRAEVIDQRLEQASIILLLISSDFLASNYCYQVEMKRALERHETGQARVIPLIVRPVDWKGAPFAHLQALPTAAKAITTWSNEDEAWVDVAQGIRKALEEFLSNKGKKETLASRAQQLVQGQNMSTRPRLFPPVWNVPYRYAFFFTGRDHLLEQLFTNFASKHDSGIIPTQALTGLGGIGKTQTAVAYAYRYRKQYQTVLWIRVQTQEDLFANFKIIAELLKLPDAHLKQRESLLASVQEWFRETTDWLLILDNADNLALVEPFLPWFASGHLLLTTRAIATGELAQPIALNPLMPDDGALCILRRANYVPWSGQLRDASPVSVKAAQRLSELMDGLPLALEQAGAYIETTGRSVSGYLDLYCHYRPEIQRHQHGVVPNYSEPVAFAWNIAREAVRQENAAAIELLYLCAYLSPNAIPYEMFTKGAHILGPILELVAANEPAFDDTIALLRKHSLIKNEVDHDADVSRLFIHPVLQDVLKDGMDPDVQHLWAERAVRVVAVALPFVEWQIMQAHARSCMSLIEQWGMTFPEAEIICQRIKE